MGTCTKLLFEIGNERLCAVTKLFFGGVTHFKQAKTIEILIGNLKVTVERSTQEIFLPHKLVSGAIKRSGMCF